VQGHVLGAAWEEITRRCARPEHALFARPRLLFTSKGTKLLYKGETLAAVWGRLEQSLAYGLDPDYFSRAEVWADLGKETACADWAFAEPGPGPSPGPSPSPGAGEPQVYLWRRCCVEYLTATWLRFGQPSSRARTTTFTPAMLGDSLEATVEFRRTSPAHRAGWIFSQAYNSVKELYDAAKTKPFAAAALEKLTWDPEVRTMLEKRGGAVLATGPQLERSYLRSKERLAQALRAGEPLSYGAREEHRVSLAFVDRMQAVLAAQGRWDAPARRTPACASPYWRLTSADYLAYLTYNANKFTFAFEWLLGQRADGGISYAHSTVLQMLLQALRSSFDSVDPRRARGLWQTAYEVRRLEAPRLGMGLSETLAQAGYGWLAPGRIDWERLAFYATLAHPIAYTDTVLYDTYRRRWPAVRDAKDDLRRVELIGH
jgi:hypothetical protein